jgi:hypothetical protein
MPTGRKQATPDADGHHMTTVNMKRLSNALKFRFYLENNGKY